jgi:hypothetical protein
VHIIRSTTVVFVATSCGEGKPATVTQTRGSANPHVRFSSLDALACFGIDDNAACTKVECPRCVPKVAMAPRCESQLARLPSAADKRDRASDDDNHSAIVGATLEPCERLSGNRRGI